MVTPELKNYIQDQLKLGLSPEAIKNALMQSGWQQVDIESAMNEIRAGTAVPRTMGKISPLSASPETGVSKPAFMASDIFQPAGKEPIFQPKSTSFDAAPKIFDASSKKKTPPNYKKFILPGISGLIIVILVVAAGFLYSEISSLNAKIDSGNNKAAVLAQTVSSLTNDKNNLNKEVGSLNQTIDDLNGKLSLFAASPNVSSSTTLAVHLTGILGGGGKKLYTVTDDGGVLIYVKNSADANVSAFLKGLVGQQVEIGGIHLPGSNYVNVTSVNGQAISSSNQ